MLSSSSVRGEQSNRDNECASGTSETRKARAKTAPPAAVKPHREFHFGNYPTHKVALRLAYHGHIHDGLAKQAETANTVEGILCEALVRLRLVPASGPEDFARCGRTDKGVSALGNVVSLTVRATVGAVRSTQGNTVYTLLRADGTTRKKMHTEIDTVSCQDRKCDNCLLESAAPALSLHSSSSNTRESAIGHVKANEQRTPAVVSGTLDYANMLNSILPPTIRVVGHASVPMSFDARFSCTGRTYRYYFCHVGLNITAMQQAAQYMLGTHNFRNLCKTDVINVNNFVRHVTAVGVFSSPLLPDMISYFEITANSFLYHQIRCTMTVLFLVGRGLEEPSVVRELLERGDAKPHYSLADAGPLVLWCCYFTGNNYTHTAGSSRNQDDRNECHQDATNHNIATATLDGDSQSNNDDDARNNVNRGTGELQQGSLLQANGEPRWQLSARAMLFAEQELHDIATALLLRAVSAEAMRQQLFAWYSTAPKQQPTRAQDQAQRGRKNREDKHSGSSAVVVNNSSARDGHDESNSGSSSRHVEVDEWSITGRDWTENRTHGAMRARRRDLHCSMQRLTEKSAARKVQPNIVSGKDVETNHGTVDDEKNRNSSRKSDTGRGTATLPHAYVRLLDRERERTYDEEVSVLTGKKRDRYNRNVEKKALAEALRLGEAKKE